VSVATATEWGASVPGWEWLGRAVAGLSRRVDLLAAESLDAEALGFGARPLRVRTRPFFVCAYPWPLLLDRSDLSTLVSFLPVTLAGPRCPVLFLKKTSRSSALGVLEHLSGHLDCASAAASKWSPLHVHRKTAHCSVAPARRAAVRLEHVAGADLFLPARPSRSRTPWGGGGTHSLLTSDCAVRNVAR